MEPGSLSNRPRLCAHGLAAGGGGQDGLRSAQLGQFYGRVLCLAVNIMVGAKLLGQPEPDWMKFGIPFLKKGQDQLNRK